MAALLIVVARSAGTPGDAQGLSMFAVPRDTPGVTVTRTVMVDAHNAARIQLSKVELPSDALLGSAGAAWTALQATLDAGRAAAAAGLLGIADEVFERTVGYLKERRQFGRAIGEFQGLQHRAAALYVDIELARAALIKALQSLDGDPPDAAPPAPWQWPRPGNAVRPPPWRCRKACRCMAAWA